MSLVIDGLSVRLSQRLVLDGLSLSIPPNEIACILGPNGTGKSTLLRTIAGLVRPESGLVLLDGADLAACSPAERARLIAVVPQVASLPEHFSVAEVVLMGRTPHLRRLQREGEADYRIAWEAMERTDVADLAARPATDLSGGEMQRVLIARALAQQPRVLLLDEATAHLDLRHQAAVTSLVRRLAADGLIVAATVHDPNLAAELGARLVLLREGRVLAQGAPADVLTETTLAEAYGVGVRVLRHPASGLPLVAVTG